MINLERVGEWVSQSGGILQVYVWVLFCDSMVEQDMSPVEWTLGRKLATPSKLQGTDRLLSHQLTPIYMSVSWTCCPLPAILCSRIDRWVAVCWAACRSEPPAQTPEKLNKGSEEMVVKNEI